MCEVIYVDFTNKTIISRADLDDKFAVIQDQVRKIILSGKWDDWKD